MLSPVMNKLLLGKYGTLAAGKVGQSNEIYDDPPAVREVIIALDLEESDQWRAH